MRALILFGFFLLMVGCDETRPDGRDSGGQPDAGPRVDAAPSDAGNNRRRDGGARSDAGAEDSGLVDAGPRDAGPIRRDAGSPTDAGRDGGEDPRLCIRGRCIDRCAAEDSAEFESALDAAWEPVDQFCLSDPVAVAGATIYRSIREYDDEGDLEAVVQSSTDFGASFAELARIATLIERTDRPYVSRIDVSPDGGRVLVSLRSAGADHWALVSTGDGETIASSFITDRVPAAFVSDTRYAAASTRDVNIAESSEGFFPSGAAVDNAGSISSPTLVLDLAHWTSTDLLLVLVGELDVFSSSAADPRIYFVDPGLLVGESEIQLDDDERVTRVSAVADSLRMLNGDRIALVVDGGEREGIWLHALALDGETPTLDEGVRVVDGDEPFSDLLEIDGGLYLRHQSGYMQIRPVD